LENNNDDLEALRNIALFYKNQVEYLWSDKAEMQGIHKIPTKTGDIQFCYVSTPTILTCEISLISGFKTKVVNKTLLIEKDALDFFNVQQEKLQAKDAQDIMYALKNKDMDIWEEERRKMAEQKWNQAQQFSGVTTSYGPKSFYHYYSSTTDSAAAYKQWEDITSQLNQKYLPQNKLKK
jgi:hypothetical protein